MKRNKLLSLGDQCNNPGALNTGKYSRRYGSRDGHTVAGNRTAIFQTPFHGSAALIDLVLSHRGHRVRDYILGDNGVKPQYSYSGGVNREDYVVYVGNLTAAGLGSREKISKDQGFLLRLVNAHSYAEGNTFRLNPDMMHVVIDLLTDRADSNYNKS